MKYSDVRAANGAGLHLEDCFRITALRVRYRFYLELIEIRKGERRATFILKDSPGLQEDVKAYFTRKLHLEALAYAASIKDTKAAIFNT